jgi:Uma2 family endonuclease
VLLIEVASHSTERIDRGEKLNAYQQIPSLVEYVIVAQDRPEIEVFRRRGGWAREVLKPDDALILDSIGLTLQPSDVYRDIGFERG